MNPLGKSGNAHLPAKHDTKNPAKQAMFMLGKNA
jgi:hypothetical protein